MENLERKRIERIMNELHLFAGAGGGILGGELLGHTTVCAVEIEEYPRKVLLQRQRDGILPRFPIWDDITTFDGNPRRGRVDVVCGGFPCQDISAAGKGAGIEGEKSGLWAEFARIIGEVLPRFVFVENSPMLTSRGLGTVLGDLASLGFDADWGVLGAHHAGGNHRAPHKRDRIWITARNSEPTLSVDDEASLLSGVATHSERKPLRDKRGRGHGKNGKGQTLPRHNGEERPLAYTEGELRRPRLCKTDAKQDRRQLANSRRNEAPHTHTNTLGNRLQGQRKGRATPRPAY